MEADGVAFLAGAEFVFVLVIAAEVDPGNEALLDLDSYVFRLGLALFLILVCR